MKKVFKTEFGQAVRSDAYEYMIKKIPDESIDLIITSPPYALLRKKKYGNENQDQYLDWFCSFADEFHRILKQSGSLVIDIGGSWIKGQPSRSLYHLEMPIRLCKEHNFYLAQEFFWENTSKLPSPAEWVTVRRIRVKDAVNCIWWMSKDPFPKANNKNVLKEYSKSMMNLFEKGYNSGDRPSEHKISKKFQTDNGGAIPPNIFKVSNTGNLHKIHAYCRSKNLKLHPARFPTDIPEFFVKMLTDEGDTVFDPFAGSCTSGYVAEKNNRNWICTDLDEEYLKGGKGWFVK
jgi:site-specific DNA-methyltransferase (cytosine-N4-specific)